MTKALKRRLYGIASVERDVGVSKDVLRVWERRYGFPTPVRDAAGQRLYASDDVARLRLIKRLMDQGHRPGRLLAATPKQLAALAAAPGAEAVTPGDAPAAGAADLAPADMKELFERDAMVLLRQRLAQQGLLRFVLDTVAPLVNRIGTEWADGRLQVHDEHRWSEAIRRSLQQAIAAVPQGESPRVLLATLPDEKHTIGLLMAEAMLVLENAMCISLGAELPLPDIVDAAAVHRADIVALSFSEGFQRRAASQRIEQMREALPRGVTLWVGGSGTRRVAVPGVEVMHTLQAVPGAVQAWRATREVEAVQGLDGNASARCKR